MNRLAPASPSAPTASARPTTTTNHQSHVTHTACLTGSPPPFGPACLWALRTYLSLPPPSSVLTQAPLARANTSAPSRATTTTPPSVGPHLPLRPTPRLPQLLEALDEALAALAPRLGQRQTDGAARRLDTVASEGVVDALHALASAIESFGHEGAAATQLQAAISRAATSIASPFAASLGSFQGWVLRLAASAHRPKNLFGCRLVHRWLAFEAVSRTASYLSCTDTRTARLMMGLGEPPRLHAPFDTSRPSRAARGSRPISSTSEPLTSR